MVADFMRYLPESKYLMVANFMRYYTRIKISYGCRSINQSICISGFYKDIVDRLWISRDITPESKYTMVADFTTYYTRIKISHGCRFHEILHKNQNIPWLHIS